MNCRISDMRYKDVINIKDGSRVGYVSDVEIDTLSACLVAIVICGRSRFFGLWGREEDVIIYWRDIVVIGEDAILVNHDHINCLPRGIRRLS